MCRGRRIGGWIEIALDQIVTENIGDIVIYAGKACAASAVLGRLEELIGKLDLVHWTSLNTA